MHRNQLLGMVLAGAACGLLLFAADSWKNKDSSQWSNDEINKILTDSPWAKEINVAPENSGYGRRRGGFGFPGGGGYPGGGYPGGGGGYPGGGYPGGPGGGYPRGGGYPGGGGYPNDSGGGRGAGPMNVTVRWDSALPVQQALKRKGASSEDEAKAVSEASGKFYVISVFGFRMPGNRRGRGSDDDSADSDSNRDRNRDNADALRSQLLDAAQLAPKGGRAIFAQDVQVESLGSELHFLFPRNPPIAPSAKEVDFILDVRGIKIEHKFRLTDMQYQGQLAL